MPAWLLGLLVTLAAAGVGVLSGLLLFRVFFAPLYRRNRERS